MTPTPTETPWRSPQEKPDLSRWLQVMYDDGQITSQKIFEWPFSSGVHAWAYPDEVRAFNLRSILIRPKPVERKCQYCGNDAYLKTIDESHYCTSDVMCKVRMRDQLSATVARAETAESELAHVQTLLSEYQQKLRHAEVRAEKAEAELRKIVDAGREWWEYIKVKWSPSLDERSLFASLAPHMQQEAKPWKET